MIVRSLDSRNDPFRPKENDETSLDLGTSYISEIDVLLCLVQCTKPNITFAVNLLDRYSSPPTWRHRGIKHIVLYLRKTINLVLFKL